MFSGMKCDVAWLNYANRCWITRCNRSSINDIQTKDSQVCVLPFSNYSAVQSCLLRPQHIPMRRFSLSDHRSMTGPTPSSKIDAFDRYQLSGRVTTHWQQSCPFKERRWLMYWTVLEHFLWSALFRCECVFLLTTSRAEGEDREEAETLW